MAQQLPHDTNGSFDQIGPRIEAHLLPGLEANRSEDSELFIRKTFETNPQKGCELLYRLYYRPMCTHAVRFVYSKEIAEDIVSEIFYSFWSKKIFLSVTTSYRAYLFRSVRNRSYNYLSNDLRKSDPLSAASDNAISPSESPERIMQMDELLEILNKLIVSLPPQCQKVFLMNRFEGRKNKEIAEELNLSPRTVETHLFKALQVLKNGLKNQWIWATALLFIY